MHFSRALPRVIRDYYLVIRHILISSVSQSSVIPNFIPFSWPSLSIPSIHRQLEDQLKIIFSLPNSVSLRLLFKNAKRCPQSLDGFTSSHSLLILVSSSLRVSYQDSLEWISFSLRTVLIVEIIFLFFRMTPTYQTFLTSECFKCKCIWRAGQCFLF